MLPSHKELQGVTWAEGRWVPKRGIVAIDTRDGMMDNQQILDLLKKEPEVGVVLISAADKDGAFWEPHSRVQRVAVRDFSLEQVLTVIQPEVLVTTAPPTPETIHPSRVVNPHPLKMGQYVVSYIEKALREGETEATAPLTERWRGSRKRGQESLGVRGLSNYVKAEPPRSKLEQWFETNPWVREYDAGIAEVGLFAGMLGLFSGEHSVLAQTTLNLGLIATPLVATTLRTLELMSQSEKARDAWKASQRVLGSATAFALGAKLALLGFGLLASREVAGSLGAQAMANEQFLGSKEQKSALVSKVTPEVPVTTKASQPEATWQGMDAYFEALLGEADWTNSENGRDLSDVMSHWVLMHGGRIESVQATLDRMQQTTSYVDYMDQRAQGQIYP